MRNFPNLRRVRAFSFAAGLTAAAYCAFGAMPSVFAQSKSSKAATYHTPATGSAERRAIMEALRGPVQKDVKTSVIFVVDEPKRFFRVAGDWAFVNAQFVHPDGSPMGKAYFGNEGAISDNVQALLRRVKGKWQVVTHVTGVTDVEWEGWPKKYNAPKSIVPSTS